MRQLYLNMKLRKKLFYTYLIVGIIPILILGYSCYRYNRNSMVKLEKENLEESFNNAVVDLNYNNDSYINLASSIIFNQMITDVINEDYESYYQMYEKYTYDLDPQMLLFQNLHEAISQITIYTTNPSIIQHGKTLMPMEMAEGEPWYPAGRENNQIRWYGGKKEGLSSVINFPESEATGIQSVLSITYHYRKYFDSMRELAGNECGVRIVDSGGNLIYEADSLEGKYRLDGTVSLAGKDEQLKVGQEDYIVLSMPVEHTNWTAYVYKPMRLVEAPTRGIVYVVVMLVLLCLILVIVVANYVSRLTIQPVERLSDYMQNMDMDNLCVTITPKSQDEIGILIMSFQALIRRIQTLIQEVYKAENDRKKYEMKALQAQINPHFLYNCLSLINWKAIMAGEQEISQMAQQLSEFYRTSLNKGKSLIRIGDELRNVRSYIEIQNILHNYTIQVEYHLDEGAYAYSMVNLTLQPIVENAIVHGLDHSRREEKRLSIEMKEEETEIEFVIADNGCGMSEEMAANILHHSTKGYGVKNVNDRLRLIYGETYGVRYETEPGVGTRVVIRIPKRQEEGV